MTKRKAITERMKILSLLYWHDIECPECGQWISSGDQVEWDHRVPVALGGGHDHTNIMACHKTCHAEKTRGTKATTYGSDIHAIAKARRIASGGRKRKGPKMKARPFQKKPKGYTHRWGKRKVRG